MTATAAKEESSDLLAQESRQLGGGGSRLYGAGNKMNQFAAPQQSVDYYDYYDYGPSSSMAPVAAGKLGGANAGGANALYGNGNGLANRKSFQQRNGQLNRLGGAASSGYGSYSGHHASYSGDEYCDNGISIALLLTALLGIAVMFYVLYVKITKGRRRRRETEELDTLEENMNPIWFAMEHFQDFVYSGTGYKF